MLRVFRIMRKEHKLKLIFEYEHASYINSIAFSPSGDFIITGGNDKMLRIFDADSGIVVFKHLHPSRINSVAFS